MQCLRFQSTPSWRGRLKIQQWAEKTRKFQSTPSWRGRRMYNYLPLKYLTISIHALVKRATLQYKFPMTEYEISIHALVKRATQRPFSQRRKIRYFNPRPREEGDWVKKTFRNRGYEHFNPRPREEGDLVSLSILYRVFVFQSTPSWRGRPRFIVYIILRHCISIHALVKRATCKYC